MPDKQSVTQEKGMEARVVARSSNGNHNNNAQQKMKEEAAIKQPSS